MLARVFLSSEPTSIAEPEPTTEAVRWGLLYAVEDFPRDRLTAELTRRHPGITLIGATSFRGVFSGRRLARGAAMLLGGDADGLTVASALRSVGPDRARAEAVSAARELSAALRRPPELVILHATPGFEEAVIGGIVEALGPSVEIYGGSAADDSVAGRWSVFTEKGATGRGFAIAGLCTSAPGVTLHGGFISGYLPTAKRGVVTSAHGRVIAQIDGEPAAAVYNRWTGGIIAETARRGGSVLLETNLHPLAREIQSRSAVPHRLLSHPHEVYPDGRLGLFTDIEVGDVVELMIGTPDPLVTRAAKVVPRSLGRTSGRIAGGLLVYCGGCLAAVLDRADDIASAFDGAIDKAPFVGVATFGEQGCFLTGRDKINRHGNLMCSSVLLVHR